MDKEQYRKEAINKLKFAQQKTHYQKDKKVNQLLVQMIKYYNPQTLMLYLPLPIEVNIMQLIATLRREKRQLYVPFMEGESFRLVKYRMPLKRKKFGIMEPKNSYRQKTKIIDFCIVPIVATDVSFRRIGFGRGMYDRFYAQEKKYIKKIVFVSRLLAIAPKIITKEYDMQGDFLVTPAKILKRKRIPKVNVNI